MKVIIINSPLFREKNDKYDEDSLPPIGLGYIATTLEDEGHAVKLIDAVELNLSIDEILNILETVKPDCVALNVFTTNKHLVQEIVESMSFKTHLIIGGLSTKEIHKDIFNWKSENKIDVVFGDGELITRALISNDLAEEPYLTQDKVRVFRVDSGSKYYVRDISDIPLNRGFFINEPVIHPLGFNEANIVTSRGCIYNCAFCAAAQSLNKEFGIREKSISSIRDELSEIKARFPEVSSIRVLDDLFLKTKHSVDKAIEVFSDSDLNWRSMAHVMTFNRVDSQKMIELKASGCNELFIGVESGSPKILKSIHKTPNPDRIRKNLESVLRAGIGIKAYFIYGFPGETQEDMQMTYDLATSLGKSAAKFGVSFRTSVFQFRPYHGTELYHLLEERDAIDNSVISIQPNDDLSGLVGRLQFNFHSGNYSNVGSDQLHDYIYRTTKLSSGKFFEAISKNNSKVK